MIMGDNSCSKGRGFESRFRIVVTFGQFSHLIIVKNVLFVKTENKRKIGQGFYLKKSLIYLLCNNILSLAYLSKI